MPFEFSAILRSARALLMPPTASIEIGSQIDVLCLFSGTWRQTGWMIETGAWICLFVCLFVCLFIYLFWLRCLRFLIGWYATEIGTDSPTDASTDHLGVSQLWNWHQRCQILQLLALKQNWPVEPGMAADNQSMSSIVLWFDCNLSYNYLILVCFYNECWTIPEWLALVVLEWFKPERCVELVSLELIELLKNQTEDK